MVIASNEWLNNYEDEQKSASVNSTGTTTNTNNSPATSSTTVTPTTTTVNNTVVVVNSIGGTATSTTAPAAAATTSATTTISLRTESDSICTTPTAVTAPPPEDNNTISNSNTTDVPQQPEHQLQLHSVINNQLQMMDESLKIEQETNEIENNNKESASTPASTKNNSITTTQSNSNTSIATVSSNSSVNLTAVNSNSNSNSNPNSNSKINTTVTPNTTTNPSPPIFNPNPITPQALSNALQSALNATSNNVTVSVNLPNSFLTSLGGVGISPNATLQHTANLAKQLSSSLSALETHTVNSNNFKTKALNDNNTAAADSSMREYQQTSANDNGNGQAKIVLHCEPNSHPFQTRVILLTPNIECKVGRLIAKSKASESNAIFDCKVLSRNHAVLWYSNDGKFWVKDTQSSNGTFINESKLGTEAAELHFGDVVKFGVDVMENSRKEVHGCIIAGVKLYLPDGRETISIESSANQLSPHSGEGRISFDELHRLNLYMQEASQREKVLKSKLFNIQNILDATRKNSGLCWQSMIAEDQLLHRIHSLEKKLQMMEKNVPESVLRNEVLKLIDDKNSYQHSAKEALRKVYQERCDAMQKLSKMESAVSASDNECKILRDQIMNTKQSLQDVNTRLLSLETEYNEYKAQTERQQQEAKEQTEQQTVEMTEKLQQRESECELLKRKISELLLKRADLLDDEEQLQKQAIEKLDAAIADMDLGDDEDDDDEDDEDEEDDDGDFAKNIANDNEYKDKQQQRLKAETLLDEKNKKVDAVNGKSAKKAQSDSGSDEEKTNSSKSSAEPPQKHQQVDGTTKQRTDGQKSTILKWLENSDLNKKEGSLDIFDAICNESDSSDDSGDNGAGTNEVKNNNKLTKEKTIKAPNESFELQYLNFNNKLQSVQQNLSKLEAEFAAGKTNNAASLISSSTMIVEENEDDEEEDDDDDDSDNDDNNSQISSESEQRNSINAKQNAKEGLHNKSYTLLKNSLIMLREAYNEICQNVQQVHVSPKASEELSKPPAISVQTQFHKYAQHKVTKSASKKLLVAQAALIACDSEENEDDIATAVATAELSGDKVARLATASSSIPTIQEIFKASSDTAAKVAEQTADKTNEQQQQQLEVTIKLLQKQIEELQAKLELNECDAQNTLEIMQIECDTFKDKVVELSKIVQTLKEEKQALQQVINENKSNTQKTAEASSRSNEKVVEVITEQLEQAPEELETQQKQAQEQVNASELLAEPPNTAALDEKTLAINEAKANSFELEMREELAAMNNATMQREEELIMYKERLEQTQSDNLRLRNEMSQLLLKSNDYTKTMLKRLAPYGAVAVAILVYFLITYF